MNKVTAESRQRDSAVTLFGPGDYCALTLQRSCFDTSAVAIKRKEPIIRAPIGDGLSALRLCVWLLDNYDI